MASSTSVQLLFLVGLGFMFSCWLPNFIPFTQACFGGGFGGFGGGGPGGYDGSDGGGDQHGSLKIDGYQKSCPEAEHIIYSWVRKAVNDDPRMAASLIRLHFHDCIVNGCDASVLLDDSTIFTGEKGALPNMNSLRGLEVIDDIKSDLETVCPETVSCADILATVARDSVVLSGGPGWDVQMGRRDSLTASKTDANNKIPGPNSNLTTLIATFQNFGLTTNDLVVLSGAHTIGKARCSTFSSRLNRVGSISDGSTLNLEFLTSLRELCSEDNRTLATLDLVTPASFDNQYYVNLVSGQGLLSSDQALMAEGSSTRNMVQTYANDQIAFFEDFKASMVKMGSLSPLTGINGQIRRNCRVVN